jgi:carbon-monoxide dehydrogenase medium subunit
LGAVAPTPLRARKAEATLQGQKLDGKEKIGELLKEVASIAASESLPIDDLRGYARFRKKVIDSLVRQALEKSIAQLPSNVKPPAGRKPQ